MKNNKPKVIFSDLFGVLLGPDYSNILTYICSVTKKNSSHVYNVVFDEDNMQFIRGEIRFEDYFSKLQYKFKKGQLIEKEMFHHLWRKMTIAEMPPTKNLLAMQGKYKLYIITNTTNTHIESLKKKFNFINQFDEIITSDSANACKPSLAVFNYACNVANVVPNEAVFIDDSPENVAKAIEFGLITHQYTTYEKFVSFLHRL